MKWSKLYQMHFIYVFLFESRLQGYEINVIPVFQVFLILDSFEISGNQLDIWPKKKLFRPIHVNWGTSQPSYTLWQSECIALYGGGVPVSTGIHCPPALMACGAHHFLHPLTVRVYFPSQGWCDFSVGHTRGLIYIMYVIMYIMPWSHHFFDSLEVRVHCPIRGRSVCI